MNEFAHELWSAVGYCVVGAGGGDDSGDGCESRRKAVIIII